MRDDLIISELRRDEGVEHHAYRDSLGYWTIGVGRLIDARKGGGISDAEIDFLLSNDIARIYVELDIELPWWRDLNAVRQRVLVNMSFNLGVRGLLGFKNTLAAVQAQQWDKASAGMMASKWSKQVGERAIRLAHMMKTGEAL